MRALGWSSVLLLIATVAGCNGDGDKNQDRGIVSDAAVTDGVQTDGAVPSDSQADPCARVEVERLTCTQTLQERFDQDTTVAKGCYLVERTPILGAAVTLTLSPGVTLIFAEDKALNVSGERKLIAAGTAQEQICMTGKQRDRGYWKGLHFDGTTTTGSTLDYVIIEYAGKTTSDRDNAGVKLTADSRGVRLSITNTTIRESQGWGLYLGGSAILGAFSKNTLTRNTLGPAWVASEVVSSLDAASSYQGNTVDQLHVKTYQTKGAWLTLDVPYYLDGSIDADGDWTIGAGATLIMANDASITIPEGTSLVAKGTSTQKILFTGATKQRGAWQGIIFDASHNTTNAFDYVTVEYAGQTTHDSKAAGVKLISDSRGVQLTMTNSTLRENQGYGLFLCASAIIPDYKGNVLTKNTLGPAIVGSQAAHQLLIAGNSSYTGNDVDQVAVESDYTSATSCTWHDIGVPYALSGNLRVNQTWTLEPGVKLIMTERGWINVGGDTSSLQAIGTAQKPIVITGAQKTKGYWDALIFDNTENTASTLEYVTVEYGGRSELGHLGEIHTTADSRGVTLSIKNSTIQQSGTCGVWLCGSAKVNADLQTAAGGNIFTDNTGGGVCREP